MLVPATSQAAVEVLQTDEAGNTTTLVKFTKAKCKKGTGKKGLKFFARARKSGYELRVGLFSGGRAVNLPYGSEPNGDYFVLEGPAGSFSNLNRPPNAPPGGGAVQFNRKRTRMGIGFSPAFNEAISSSVSFAGGLKCVYPKKKKKKRKR